MGQDEAETIALQALGWIAANEELLPVFLGSTGASLDELRTRVDDPAFLVSVLSFLTMDDAWVLGFAEAAGVSPEAPLAARRALPGGEEVAWT